MRDYVKVWLESGNEIPFDEDGRSFEIHHINGDHSDNRIENLKCVSIKEHYEIHKDQGDFVACQLISKRMNLTPEEISLIKSESNKQRAREGRHPAQIQTREGRHLFQVNNPTHKRIKEKTHNFQTDNPGRKAWENGNHNWGGIHPSKKMVISMETGYITNILSKTKYDKKTGMRHTWLPI